jgi:hypothetical protein
MKVTCEKIGDADDAYMVSIRTSTYVFRVFFTIPDEPGKPVNGWARWGTPEGVADGDWPWRLDLAVSPGGEITLHGLPDGAAGPSFANKSPVRLDRVKPLVGIALTWLILPRGVFKAGGPAAAGPVVFDALSDLAARRQRLGLSAP